MVTSTPTDPDARTPLPVPRARIGLIIPSVNTCSEPQFHHFAPAGLGIHVARARIVGPWQRPLPLMAEEIVTAAQHLADCGPDLLVFHCTETAMAQGPQGEERLLAMIREATGVETVATSQLVREAFQALGLRTLVLLTPYRSNHTIIAYLQATGFTVAHDVALGLQATAFSSVTPQQWVALARDHARCEADGIFLSCTNTTQIEAIVDIECALGLPVVNSNQAVLWGGVRRLRRALPPVLSLPPLGRLMQQLA
jgi:maleate isomerase